jgi:glycosyltransferase involved in cell wall biosynthesis
VLVDGLVGSTAPEVLEGLAVRARVLLLVHMPLLDRREARVVSAAHGFVVTSGWTRQRLLEVYRLAADVVHVALPGTDPAAVSPASVDGRRLLIVGPISRAKGHDVLMTALDALDEPWQLEVVGSRTVDPETASRLERWAVSRSVDITGPLRPAAVAAAYARADLLVHPSRAETYGMVVTEALARGIPVAASDVGGTREALGMGRSGLPGRLLAPADPPALAGVLRAWLSDAALRSQLRTAAAERRRSLPSWSATVDAVAAALRAPRLVGVPQ